MEFFKTEEKLPKDGEWVLVVLNKSNWHTDDDGERHLFDVCEFTMGISQEERNSLSDSDERKKAYISGDEGSNNLKPYVWQPFGPGYHFGQEVALWCELPSVKDLFALNGIEKEKRARNIFDDKFEEIAKSAFDSFESSMQALFNQEIK